ncbi:hypothetical protein ACVNF4_04490 [Streptomyces sp. S6]
MTTDLAALTAAATRWDGMAAELNKQETAYSRDVHGISLGTSWLGLSAGAANRRFDVTLKEFQNAQVEAKAIASLLRDAHTQFAELRGKLESARADAVAEGMKVSEQGIVAFDTAALDAGARSAYVHDPDYQASVRKSVASWQARLDQAVAAVTDADHGVEIALKAVVVDSDPNDGTLAGFNGGALGDIEQYEARAADDIAGRLAQGEKVSAAELAELQRAFRDNAGDKAFSQAFLSGLGPEAMLKLAGNAVHTQIQGGLADVLATATQVPGSAADMPPGSAKFKEWLASSDGTFYRQWSEGLDKAGTKNFGSKSNPLYGYQSLAALMQHAGTGYDDQFLGDTAGRMISAERAHPGLFTQWGPGHDGVRADALDSVLGLMSRNPDAATAFFDPARPSGGDHLHYLLGEGAGTRAWPRHVLTGVSVMELDDPLSRTGLGAALEAAATGHPPLAAGQDPWPGMNHTEAQARVTHAVVTELAPTLGTDTTVQPNLRQPLARALAEYTSDTHEILGGMRGDYVRAVTGDGYFTDGGTAHLAVSQKDLVQVMRGLSEDPDAYATLHKAESRYIDTQLRAVPENATGFEHSAPLGKAGATLGVYSAIREDVINDGRMAAYSEADWKSKVAYHVVGGAVTPLYVTTGGVSIAFGDAIQRGVDTWAWQWGNAMKADADATADAAIADEYLAANNQMALMVESWADDRADIDRKTPAGQAQVQALTDDMLNGHDRGSNLANKYLTDTSN